MLEKKKREDAEKKALEIEDKLRKAETKAKAAEARQRRAQKEVDKPRGRPSASPARRGSGDSSHSLTRDGDVGVGRDDGGGGGGGGTTLPPLPNKAAAAVRVGEGGVGSAAHAQQAPLVAVVDEERLAREGPLRQSSSVMADAVAAAAEALPDDCADAAQDTGGDDLEKEGGASREEQGQGHEHEHEHEHEREREREREQLPLDDSGSSRLEVIAQEQAGSAAAAPETDQMPGASAPASGAAPPRPVATSSAPSPEAAPLLVQAEYAHQEEGHTQAPVPTSPASRAQVSAPGTTSSGLRARSSDQVGTGMREDDQDYEDRPIGNVAPITAAPPPAAAASAEAAPAEPQPSFSVEVSQPTSASAAGPTRDATREFTGREFSGGEGGVEDEIRAIKTEMLDESSPWTKQAGEGQEAPARLCGEDGGPTRGAQQQVGHPHPQAIPIDARLVYQTAAEQFRSELRVGTGGVKFDGGESLEGLEGWRVGTTATCMSQGVDAMELNTMFDDESLLPPALQAMRRVQEVAAAADAQGAQDKENEQRCESVTLVAKAEPSPLPEFGLHIEVAEQTMLRPGVEEEQALPVRKLKGKVDKRREEGVEIVFMPTLTYAEGAEETKERIQEMQKVLGLPKVLWDSEAYRSDKVVIKPNEEQRNARQSRSEEISERVKGDVQTHITRASKPVNESEAPPPPELDRDKPPINRGEAIEGAKQLGENARAPPAAAKELDLVSVLRDNEWALDEYIREGDPAVDDDHWAPAGAGSVKEVQSAFAAHPPGGPPVGAPGEAGAPGENEVVEIKFDVSLANDEEREAFARVQRARLAKMLGLQPEDIDIVDVKPGSPVTVMRFQIPSQDAARIRSAGPRPGGEARGAETSAVSDGQEGIDERAIHVDILSSSGGLAHQQLSERLRSGLPPAIQVRDSAGTAAAVAAAGRPRSNESTQGDQRSGKTIGRVDEAVNDPTLERLLTHERAKGINYEDQPGADQDYAHLHTEKPGERDSQGDTGKDKAPEVGADAEVVENSHRPGRELMSDSQYSSAKVQRRGGREARRMKSDDLVQEQNVGMQGKVGFEECLDTERRKEGEDELNFLPAQRSNPGPRTAIVARKDDGLEAPSFTGLREHERRIVVKEIDLPCNQPSIYLTKSYEECTYALKDKIPGYEDPRTSHASEPLDLGFDARQNKKKGKEALKLEMPAVPEAYMAFGQEGASQRLMPGVVTLEKPGANAVKGKGKGEWSDEEEEPQAPIKGKDMISSAPDVIQMKFDVAFVDDDARQAFALKQATKLAQFLQLPEDYVSVRSAMPGSPMTVVAFEIMAGAAARSAGGRAPDQGMARTNRPFDSPVLEVGVVSAIEEHADALQIFMAQIVGNQVPVQRIKGGKAVAGVLGGAHAKNVKFGADEHAAPTPAYQRTREELEEQAAKRFSGPTMSDKETVDNDSSATVKRPMKEFALKDDKPIVVSGSRSY